MMISNLQFQIAVVFFSMAASAIAQTSSSIVNTRHNLSVSGPGPIKSTNEQQICIFCHTPHNASPIQPLWNRNLPVTAYIPYSSNSLQAKPGQPTGASKLCLSCHDGTIALGSVLTTDQPIHMAGGMTTLPPNHPANLGTDLSDDHPISFRYDDALVSKNPKLVSPSSLPPPVRLDSNRELQCTTCHEAHDNSYGKFLVMDNSQSQLCNSCHREGTTTVVDHASCAGCHKPHTAPSGPYLLTGVTVTDTCLSCHSGSGAAGAQGANIQADLNKLSRHDTRSPVNQTDHAPNNLVCDDCHEGHTMGSAAASAPLISPRLGKVSGVSASGAVAPVAQFEYEVCFKCHGDQAATAPRLISRVIVQNNKRLQVASNAVSFHPIEIAGKNMDVPSLRTGYTTSSIIYCSDCHASDTSKAAGGTGPNGPHGSAFSPLLIARYDTTDNSAESSAAYALCYNCHDRASILSNRSFTRHNSHIVTDTTPCSVCHDSHGIDNRGNMVNNSHLINFDVTVVQPLNQTTPITFDGMARSCTLTCHGKAHDHLTY